MLKPYFALPGIPFSVLLIPSLLLLLLRFFQEVYGRLGNKPDKVLIESFEHFVLESSENLKASRMLKVTITRCIQLSLLTE